MQQSTVKRTKAPDLQGFLPLFREELKKVQAHPFERLPSLMEMIAHYGEIDSASLYVVRAGITCELVATYGLNPQALFVSRLAIGEGVTGLTAQMGRPLHGPKIAAHPNYKYKIETDEDDFSGGFVSLPIIYNQKVVGVLSLRSKEVGEVSPPFRDTLEILCLLMAEVVFNLSQVSSLGLKNTVEGSPLTRILQGISVHHGLTQGYALLHQPQLRVMETKAKNKVFELERLKQALHNLNVDLVSLQEQMTSDDQTVQDILSAFQMIAQDKGWKQFIRDRIEEGLSAETAAQKFLENYRLQAGLAKEGMLKERLWDVEDLTGRLLKYLNGFENKTIDPKKPLILIAKSMGPAEFLEYRKYNVQAIVLEEGMQTAHVSIIAKALDIPMIICVPDVTSRIEEGEFILLDGRSGKLTLAPNNIVMRNFQQELQKAQIKKQMALKAQGQKAVSKDGIEIDIKVNAGLLSDLDHFKDLNVSGVGLYRTEIPFMMGKDFIGTQDQVKIYQSMIEEAHPYPVTFRTLDVGGDKLLPYLHLADEANPMMGWRAIRIGLDRPILLSSQLRALLKAASGKTLHIMFPMITEVEEFLRAKELLHREMDYAQKHNPLPPFLIKVGAMIEVPSLVWRLNELLPHVDFLSLGTNDLCQFFFAADRGNPYIAKRYDTLSSVFLSYLEHIQEVVSGSGKPLSVCGEMASNPIELLALLSLGFRSFSMARSAVGPAKLMLQSAALTTLGPYVRSLIKSGLGSVRNELKAFAFDHNILI